jgi:23S rRNA pseudouridine1911/1915/1917 synthase
MNDSRTKRPLDPAERQPQTAQGVDQRAGGVARAGHDRHAGRLVDEEELFVGSEDAERDGLGEEPGTRAVAEDDDALAGDEPRCAAEDGPTVEADATGGAPALHAPDGDGEPLGDDDVEPAPAALHLDSEGRPKIIEVRFDVEEDFHGFRVDHYLKQKIRRLSRTRIQEVVRTQLEVERDGARRRLKPHSPVAFGDRLVIRREARAEPPCPRTFGVLYEDDDVVVVDKPAGLPVHASARYHFNTLTRLLAERWPGGGLQIAHRLDRETSGCLVVARGRAAASKLKGAFERRLVGKLYLAVVRGRPDWDERQIDLPLALARPRQLDHNAPAFRIRMEDATGRDDALPASTAVSVLERRDGCALVACKPATGRQHQIRAHLAAVGHPIVGDKLYAHGDEAFVRWCDRATHVSEAEVRAEFGLSRQALHAASITFPHPTRGTWVTVDSPLPAELRLYLDATR